jgi:hypothetical protein
MFKLPTLVMLAALVGLAVSCSSNEKEQTEQISVAETPLLTAEDTVKANVISGGVMLNQLISAPNRVVLTGMPQHRLVTVYKQLAKKEENGLKRFNSYSDYDYGYSGSERVEHFMPGLDIVYGYNLISLAHYDMTTERTNQFFSRPVLVKTLYYPSFVQDSLNRKPITRNYYLVSVYDADTNGDTLITKDDLRRFYYFNASVTESIQLIPSNYSAVRSQYDSMNDVMYIFARLDENSDGLVTKREPMHIFWVNLKNPVVAKLMY